LATDRWRRRKGFPRLVRLVEVGKATPCSTSTRPRSPQPTRGRPRPPPSVGPAALFSLLQGIGGGDPAFRSLPSHPHKACQSGPDGLPRDPPVEEPLLEGDLGGHLSSVRRVEPLSDSLGERCGNPLTASAPRSSKAARVQILGREEPGVRARGPLSSKSWMASRTVCWPHPRFSATCGTRSPLELRPGASGNGARRRKRLWSAARLGGVRALRSRAHVRRSEVSWPLP
jgi:hypothetical protein